MNARRRIGSPSPTSLLIAAVLLFSLPCRAQQPNVEHLNRTASLKTQVPEAQRSTPSATAASNSPTIPGRLSSDQLKAILAAADEENRRAFSDLVEQTAVLPATLLSIQE